MKDIINGSIVGLGGIVVCDNARHSKGRNLKMDTRDCGDIKEISGIGEWMEKANYSQWENESAEESTLRRTTSRIIGIATHFGIRIGDGCSIEENWEIIKCSASFRIEENTCKWHIFL